MVISHQKPQDPVHMPRLTAECMVIRNQKAQAPLFMLTLIVACVVIWGRSRRPGSDSSDKYD